MANFTKFRWFGYLDLCTTVSELVFTSVCTTISVYLEFRPQQELKKSYFFSPTFNLICTLFIVFSTVKQIECARQLVRAGNNYLFIVELAKIRDNWIFWNWINCVLALIWFPCFGLTMFLENGWYAWMVITFFCIVVVSRTFLTYGVLGLKVDEINPRAVPDPGQSQQRVAMSNLQRADTWM